MTTLLEREGELETLDLLIERTLAGEPVLALIEGPAGIGKSGLLAAAVERSRAAGFRVLSARASDLERELPFGVVRQLFEPVLSGAQLAGPAERAARVFEPLADGGGFDVSFAVLDGLYWLTANIAADAPVALAVDDLHWCDRESLRYLAYLGRRG